MSCLVSERCATWLRNRLRRPSADALTTRAKAAIDLRERQNEGRRLPRKEVEKFIRYRIDDANRSSALAGMGGSWEAVDDLRVTRCRRRPRADALHVVRAIRRQAPPSGCLPDLEARGVFVGLAERIFHHKERLVRRRVRAMNFGNEARAGSRGRFNFELPLGWWRSAIFERDCGTFLRRPPVKRFAVLQLKTSRRDSARCCVVSVRLPGKPGSGGFSISLSA